MDAIETKAREVEAALREQVIHHRDLSNPLYMSAHGRLLHQAAEVIAALTPPEGYVLVDAKLLGAVRVARLAILQKEAEAEQMDEPHDASMWAECAADLDAIAPRGVLAARPEVKT